MTRIMKSGQKCVIILPKKLVEGMKWKVGDKLKVEVSGRDRLELRKDNLSAQPAINEPATHD